MKTLLYIITLISFISCSSFSEKIVSRMDGADERPEWASEGKAMYEKNGRLYAVGYTEVSGDARVSSAMRVADNNARHEVARLITNTTSYMFQNAEEGVDGGAEMARFYGNELSKYQSHGTRQESRYWERVLTFDSNEEKVLKLRIYSLVSLTKKDVKKAIKLALQKNKQKISPEMQKAVDNHMTAQIQTME
ncbi:MAG: hypothetical protein KAG61_03670 [Bacteriovoracaceae bacterium]|nr:hypothetical protein [Bacteriovoracaceae bacterium]